MTDILNPTAAETVRRLAVVTDASFGIGFELAKLFAEDGYDLIIAADTALAEFSQTLTGLGDLVSAWRRKRASVLLRRHRRSPGRCACRQCGRKARHQYRLSLLRRMSRCHQSASAKT